MVLCILLEAWVVAYNTISPKPIFLSLFNIFLNGITFDEHRLIHGIGWLPNRCDEPVAQCDASTPAHSQSVIAIDLIRHVLRRSRALVEEAHGVLQALCVAAEVDSLGVVEHVVFTVEKMARLLGRLDLFKREDEKVLREAALALHGSARIGLWLLGLVKTRHTCVALWHLVLVEASMRLLLLI